jgi:hypothetical protein
MIAASLSINVASQADITRGSIGGADSWCGAFAKLLKDGGKLTQEAIASLADVSQGWVSKFFAGLGGWRIWLVLNALRHQRFRHQVCSLLQLASAFLTNVGSRLGHGVQRPEL